MSDQSMTNAEIVVASLPILPEGAVYGFHENNPDHTLIHVWTPAPTKKMPRRHKTLHGLVGVVQPAPVVAPYAESIALCPACLSLLVPTESEAEGAVAAKAEAVLRTYGVKAVKVGDTYTVDGTKGVSRDTLVARAMTPPMDYDGNPSFMCPTATEPYLPVKYRTGAGMLVAFLTMSQLQASDTGDGIDVVKCFVDVTGLEAGCVVDYDDSGKLVDPVQPKEEPVTNVDVGDVEDMIDAEPEASSELAVIEPVMAVQVVTESVKEETGEYPKATVQVKELKAKLARVGKGVAGKSTLPVLANVLIGFERDGRISLKATDLSIGIVESLPARVESTGAITVNHKNMADVVGKLMGEMVTFTIDPSKTTIFYECARVVGKRTFKQDGTVRQGIEADEFPTIPLVTQSENSITMTGEAYLSALQHITPFAATDDTRPVLAGIHHVLKNGRLTIIAADGFRAARTVRDVDTDGTAAFIAPARPLITLAELLDPEQNVTITVSEGGHQLAMQQGSLYVVSRLIDGMFPDVNRIIPSVWKARAIIPHSEFDGVAKASEAFAKASQGVVKLQLADESLTITANAAEVGNNSGEAPAILVFANAITNEDEPEGTAKGMEAVIALNYVYLRSILDISRGVKEMAMEMQTPQNPAVFKEVGGDPDYVAIIMPMSIR